MSQKLKFETICFHLTNKKIFYHPHSFIIFFLLVKFRLFSILDKCDCAAPKNANILSVWDFLVWCPLHVVMFWRGQVLNDARIDGYISQDNVLVFTAQERKVQSNLAYPGFLINKVWQRYLETNHLHFKKQMFWIKVFAWRSFIWHINFWCKFN